MSRRIAFGIGGGISSAALFAIGLLTGALGPAWAEPACTLDRAVSTTIDDKPFITNGYGSRWNHETNRVAFMAPRQTGYYGIFTMSPDGSGRRAFDPPGVPEKHRGMVYWRPDGRYLLFAAQKADWNGGKAFGIPGFGALPGFGVHDDIWLATADGAKAWRLTDEPNVETEGELMPIFSPDGKRIAWSSRQPDKTYVLKIADLALAPKPHLENVKSYLPGGAVYYEPGSFSSDGASLIYTSDQDFAQLLAQPDSQARSGDRQELAAHRRQRLQRASDRREDADGRLDRVHEHQGRRPFPAAPHARDRLVGDASRRLRRQAADANERQHRG